MAITKERELRRRWFDSLPEKYRGEIIGMLSAELQRRRRAGTPIPETPAGQLAVDALFDEVIDQERERIEQAMLWGEAMLWGDDVLQSAQSFVAKCGGKMRVNQGLRAVLVSGLTAVQERELMDLVPTGLRVWPDPEA